MIVYLSIGNSDDKLTQAEWSRYIAEMRDHLGGWAKVIHGTWFSHSGARWQNAAWCVEFGTGKSAQAAKDGATEIRRRYRQDSAAWAVAETEFI